MGRIATGFKFSIPVFVVLTSILISHIFQLWMLLGFHRHTHNHVPGVCRTVPPIYQGSEDVTVLPHGIAFVSSGIKLPGRDNSKIQGNIYTFDFNNPDNNATEMKLINFDKSTFAPHGINYYKDIATNTWYLFVVNHHPVEERVERFRIDLPSNSLYHEKTFKDPGLWSINDIAVTSINSFYASNDRWNEHKKTKYQMLEFLFLVKWGSIAYYDGQRATTVSYGYMFPNGVNISPNGRYVAVVTFLGQSLHIFERNLSDNNLKKIKEIKLNSHCDNVEFDPDNPNDLWLGCHPILWRCFQKPGPNSPPSQVLKVTYDPSTNSTVVINELYEDDGRVLIGSAGAAHYRGKLLIGTVFQDLMLCDIATPY